MNGNLSFTLSLAFIALAIFVIYKRYECYIEKKEQQNHQNNP